MDIIEYVTSVRKNDFSDSFGECKFIQENVLLQQDINTTEKHLGIPLPENAKKFLSEIGTADCFGLQFFSPDDLYFFDESTWEMEGFLPSCMNCSGYYVAFNSNKGGL